MRKVFRVLIISSWLLTLSACGSLRSRSEEMDTASETVAYDICKTAIDKGNYVRAVRDYKRFIGRFPFGPLSEQAQMDLAFSQFKANDSEEALATVNRFIKTYPVHKNIDYGYYLKALISSERDRGVADQLFPADRPTHDLSASKQAYLDFAEFLKRFPDSSYGSDARQRMIALRAVLADSELRVASYYFRRGAYVGAISRARNLLENYQNTTQAHDALAVMIESYLALGEDKLAADTTAVLKLNAPEHAYFTGAAKKRWWAFGR